MDYIVTFIIGFIVVSIIVAKFPIVRAWLHGGFEGVREYKKIKKDNF
tara:strand:+ start:382 stop:522 length:141 start_codon:yes stop_codon:yes gene_type:complete